MRQNALCFIGNFILKVVQKYCDVGFAKYCFPMLFNLPALGGMEGIVPTQHKQTYLKELCTHASNNGKME